MDADGLTRLASVVVVAQNRAGLIGATLESVVRSNPAEIIVIDDESTDDTAAVARRHTDRVIASPGLGLAVARQFGAEQASGRYVVFVDSDVVLADGCLSLLVEALEDDPELGAVVAMQKDNGPSSYWSRSADETKRRMGISTARRDDVFACATVAIRREIILEIRFDPFFKGAAEDRDFSRRVHQAGWKILRRENAIVHHRRRTSVHGLVRQQMWYGRGSARLAVKFSDGEGRRASPIEHAGWRRRAARDRRLSLVPYMVVSGVAYRLGFALESRQLRAESHNAGAGTSS